MDSTGATVLLVYSTSTVATVSKVLFCFVFVFVFVFCFFFVFFFSFCNQFVFFFLWNIYVSWYIYCYIDTTNFTMFLQLLTCQFLTSRNKIIKYETVTNQLKINVLRKCYNIYYYHNIFTIVEITVSYQSNKKNAKSTTF